VVEGNPSLREVANEGEVPPTEADKQLLNEMLTFLKNRQDEKKAEEYNLRPGVALAAPQLAIHKRLVAIHFEDANGKLYSYGLIIPRIVSHSVVKAYLAGGGGCRSVDGQVDGYVPRHARVTIKATTLDGKELKLRLRDYAAIVFQHELDHLNGVMFYEH